MVKKELMKTILNDYTAAHPSVDSKLLESFCVYAEQWLATRGIVGVGLAAEGVMLRLNDGTEAQLFEAIATPFIPSGTVQVTGTESVTYENSDELTTT